VWHRLGLLCTGISTWGIVAGVGNMVLAAVHVLLWIFFHDLVGTEVTQSTSARTHARTRTHARISCMQLSVAASSKSHHSARASCRRVRQSRAGSAE
jgi:hypothetical protein